MYPVKKEGESWDRRCHFSPEAQRQTHNDNATPLLVVYLHALPVPPGMHSIVLILITHLPASSIIFISNHLSASPFGIIFCADSIHPIENN